LICSTAKTEEVGRKEAHVLDREKELHKIQAEVEELKRLTHQELQRVAGLSAVEGQTIAAFRNCRKMFMRKPPR